MGAVLDAANGMETIQESMVRLVLTPAGLNGIEFYEPDESVISDPANLVPVFANLLGSPGILNQISPSNAIFTVARHAGNIIATPSQMVEFMQALVTGQILSEASLSQMLMFSNSNGRVASQYGFGVEQFTLTVNGMEKMMIGHSGDINYNSLLLFDPMDTVGVAIITNNFEAEAEELLDLAAELFEAYDDLGIPTSIDPSILEISTFNIYPNPVQRDAVNVEYSLLQNAYVRQRIFNANGQVLFTTAFTYKTTGQQQDIVRVDQLNPGTYFLTVEIDGQIASKPFIVK